MARLLGDQRQQQQLQVAGGEDPWATAAAFAPGAFFETVVAVAVLTVGVVVFSHFLFLLCD